MTRLKKIHESLEDALSEFEKAIKDEIVMNQVLINMIRSLLTILINFFSELKLKEK